MVRQLPGLRPPDEVIEFFKLAAGFHQLANDTEKRDKYIVSMEQTVKDGDYETAVIMSKEAQSIMPWVEVYGPQMVLVQAFAELKMDQDNQETQNKLHQIAD